MDFSSAHASQPAAMPLMREAAAHPFTLSGMPGALPRAPAKAPAPAGPAAAMAAHRPDAAHLLLFVGEAVRPDAPLAALLARAGLRCLSLPGTEQALRAAALARFDAVLVAADLVDGHGARAIETLAAMHRCPVVVLAEAADEVDEIVALELGADLYLARPLSPRRLRAHLAALLRRRATEAPSDGAATAPSPPLLQAAGWTLEIAQQRLTRGPRNVRLTHTQTALLRCLLQAAGRIVPPDELLAALPRHGLRPAGLRVTVHRLRQRLRDEGVEGLCLESVRGSGYALSLPIERAA